MTAEAIELWKEKLRQYEIADVREGMARFIGNATREEARGVVLGDLIRLIRQAAEEKLRNSVVIKRCGRCEHSDGWFYEERDGGPVARRCKHELEPTPEPDNSEVVPVDSRQMIAEIVRRRVKAR